MYKLSYNISFAEWKRKWLLLLIINFCITPIEMLANYKIESSNYILRIASKDKGRLLLQNKQSETLVQLGELKLGQWPQLELKNNCKYEITEVNGASAIRIHYFFPPSVPTSMKLTGTFIVHQDRVDVQYLLSGVPEKYKADWKGCQFRFCLPENAGTQKLPEAKLGIWQRDAKGGLPLETADAKIFPFLIKNRLLCLTYGADNKVDSNWQSEDYRHTILPRQEDGNYFTQFSILFPPYGWPYEAISAKWQKRPFALTLTTEKVYNWWEDATAPIGVQAKIINTSPVPQKCILKYWIRDYDGNYIVNDSKKYFLETGEVQVHPIEFTADTEREIYFVEVSVEDENGKEQIFSRTSLAILPPHEFKATPDENIMGLSAYWAIPDSMNLKRLLNRMGVRWVRNGITSSFKNIEATFHNNIDWKKKWKDTEREELIRSFFRKIVKNGNKIWEFGNELNMSSPDIAGAGEGIGKASLAEAYIEWLKAIRKVQKEKTEWQNIQIISFGIAGADEVFLEKIVELGGWDLLDGIALHPGRGNFTPDFPVIAPWEDFKKPAFGYQYWNYYGSIRVVKNFIQKHGGDKDLYLTEIYALDYPNHSWNDTPREAAENLLLSYALAAAEGVKNALYYQLFNSVWFDHLGVNATNREYFFGMINRDLSFKPSLMAFCNTAEVLDKAVFKGWIRMDEKHPCSRGILFDTPRGSMAVLWDRTEGNILTHPNGDIFPEPWVSSWKTKKRLTLPSNVPEVTLLNAIGQKQIVPTTDNQVTIELTGAPCVIYGIDASRIQLYH